VFKATQATAGLSGASEPVVAGLALGGTVVDNEVTWEGVYASRVVWEASLRSSCPDASRAGLPEHWPAPPSPTGTVLWTAMNARVTQAPDSRVLADGGRARCSSGDDDIVRVLQPR
jgi:hypothetical protein